MSIVFLTLFQIAAATPFEAPEAQAKLEWLAPATVGPAAVRMPGGPPRLADTLVQPFAQDVFDTGRCYVDCMDVVYRWATAPYFTRNEPRSFGMVYNSRQAFVAPVIMVDADADGALIAPTTMRMRLLIGGVAQPHLDTSATEVFFDGGAGRNRLAFQPDANHLPTGYLRGPVHAPGTGSLHRLRYGKIHRRSP